MNPLGLFLEPPGPLLTHLHTVYMAYSERLPTRLNPLAERACCSQVDRMLAMEAADEAAAEAAGGQLRCAPPRQASSRSTASNLGETGPLSQGVQARRKALRIRHINGTEVRKKRPTGFKKEARGVQVSPLNPLSVAPWR